MGSLSDTDLTLRIVQSNRRTSSSTHPNIFDLLGVFMESFTSEFLNTFADTIQDESTHIIECVDGKKKWLFYFVDGQLALTKSNLKHEQTEAIRESDPDASASDIPLIQATMRVSECISIETINIKTTSILLYIWFH